jgi:hypothetical protein
MMLKQATIFELTVLDYITLRHSNLSLTLCLLQATAYLQTPADRTHTV